VSTLKQRSGEQAAIRDILALENRKARAAFEGLGMYGVGVAVLRDGYGDLLDVIGFHNKITDIGDEFYAKRGIASINSNGVTAPAIPTGMRLGTGSTAESKAGAGAAIVTYVTASQVAFDSTYPTITNLGTGLGWQARFQSSWAAGVATATGIAEAVITNETPITNVAGTAANTIARALLSPTVNKGASDTLTVTWDHKFLG
jgi:hypothetical protein